MPLHTETYDIPETIEELHEEMDEQAAKAAEFELNTLTQEIQDADTPGEVRSLIESGLVDNQFFDEISSEGNTLQQYISGLHWYQQEYGDTLTLGALTNGERNQVDDIANTTTAWVNAYIALGTVDAGYLEHDPDDFQVSNIRATIQNVVDMHPMFANWVQDEIHGLSEMGEEMGNSFSDLVVEKRTQENSAETNG